MAKYYPGTTKVAQNRSNFQDPDYELELAKLKEGLKSFAENLKVYTDYQKTVAKLIRNYYQELVKNNFTEEQALELVKAHGFMPLNKGSTLNYI